MKGWMKITLLVVIIFIAVGSFYYITFSSFFESAAPPVSSASYLVLEIYGDVPERPSIDPFDKVFSGETPSLEALRNCIQKAKIDPKIVGIVLRPYFSDIGWAQVEELRSALVDFKTSGKSVYTFIEMAGNREYYLASLSDMIVGTPTGLLFINGLSGGGYYLKGTLDAIGVQADFVAIGKYKNAPDMFTRETMSSAQREVINAILSDYYPRYIQTVSAGRGLPEEAVERAVDKGLLNMSEAVELNLVDNLYYYNEFKEIIKEQDGKNYRLISFDRYNRIPVSRLNIKPKQDIALIYGVGNIVSGLGEQGMEDGLITSEAMAAAIRKAAENDKIKAIVLRINSPGGSGTASDIIWREVVEARKRKPVVVSMSEVAASGGYYISMAADSLVALPSSIVGSIGVFSGKFSMSGLYDKLGINKEEISRGENANLFSELSTFSPEQRRLMMANIQQFYQVFLQKAASGRGMTVEAVHEVAQGRVWTGTQALEAGLIDRLGGLPEAIQVAKKMAGIPADEYVRLRTFPKRRSFLQKLLSRSLEVRLDQLGINMPASVQHYLKGFFYYQDFEPLCLMPFYPEIK
ncbi:MAG: signal peptide peptidase SppA [Calditrichia bacterium]